MNIRRLKTMVIGPILLAIPMACMQLGDGSHDGGHGGHHSLQYRQNPIDDSFAKSMAGREPIYHFHPEGS